MDTWFELWDSDSANLIGSYATEPEVLRFLGQSLDDHGAAAFVGLVLTEEATGHDEPRVIAAGLDLAKYVLAARAAGFRRTA